MRIRNLHRFVQTRMNRGKYGGLSDKDQSVNFLNENRILRKHGPKSNLPGPAAGGQGGDRATHARVLTHDLHLIQGVP